MLGRFAQRLVDPRKEEALAIDAAVSLSVAASYTWTKQVKALAGHDRDKECPCAPLGICLGAW